MIETACQHLIAQCRKQCDELRELQITIAEDRPLHRVVKLVDQLGESAQDALGNAEEALANAVHAETAFAQPADAIRARRALVDCQDLINQLQQQFFTSLVCYEIVDELVTLGRQRGGEWQAWVDLVRETLARCQERLFDTQHALFQCWQEITAWAVPSPGPLHELNEPKRMMLIKNLSPGPGDCA